MKDILRKLAEDLLTAQADYSRSLTALLDGRSCASCAAMEQTCFCPIPDEWIDALASELEAAVGDRCIEWLRTLKEGRPPVMFVVEWEARDLEDTGDVQDMLAEMGQARRDLGERERFLADKVSDPHRYG